MARSEVNIKNLASGEQRSFAKDAIGEIIDFVK